MSLSSKVTLSFLIGAFSALLAWLVVDFNGVYRLQSGGPEASFLQSFSHQAFIGAIFGLFIGLGLGLVNGLSAGTSAQLRRYLWWGGTVGIVGGILGIFFGQLIFGLLHRDPGVGMAIPGLGPVIFALNIFARAVGWALIGMLIGLVQGLPVGSIKAARYGAIGGFIGGFLGGMLFELIPYVIPAGAGDPSVLVRGISMTITGASIGFFAGLVEMLFRRAWVRVAVGRNEGKEYIISKPRTSIGRDELADISLFGDHSVSPLHALIESSGGGRYVLRDVGTPLGTSVRGQKVSQHMLRDGDVIEIGSMRLEYHEKATASQFVAPAEAPSKPLPKIPQLPNVCPFCGGFKDPNTGACECSVGGQAASSQGAPAQAGPAEAVLTQGAASFTSGGGPRLVGVGGVYSGQSFAVSTSDRTTIGREPGRSIQLDADPTVSRRHASLVNESGTYVLYDEGSSNGTMVNGVQTSQQALRPGDVVQFGSAAFRFEQ